MFKSVGYIPKSGIAHHMVILSLTFYIVLCLYYGYGKNMKLKVFTVYSRCSLNARSMSFYILIYRLLRFYLGCTIFIELCLSFLSHKTEGKISTL